MSELASLNLKLPSTLKNDFTQTAEALGMPAATALKVFITRFVEVGGFPFDVRIQRQGFNWNDPRIIRTYHQNGKLMMPAQWRDEDDDDDVEQSAFSVELGRGRGISNLDKKARITRPAPLI